MSTSGRDERPRCPVCRARFAEALTCGRCQADLRPLMRLQAASYRLREEGRAAWRAGDPARARALVARAQSLRHTAAGAALERALGLCTKLGPGEDSC